MSTTQQRTPRHANLPILLKELKLLRKEITNNPQKDIFRSWVFNDKETQALETVIDAVEDCV